MGLRKTISQHRPDKVLSKSTALSIFSLAPLFPLFRSTACPPRPSGLEHSGKNKIN